MDGVHLFLFHLVKLGFRNEIENVDGDIDDNLRRNGMEEINRFATSTQIKFNIILNS